ncbi:MAG: leucine-rich repeat protein, partial [Clostridia bacterium]|nr:leucine-rich repeat protein [Clostridia bacterium]
MKRIISLLLAVIMLLGIAGIGTYAAEEGTRFKDLKETAWYVPSIDLMYSYGVVSGFDDGCYYPNENVSLAEYSLMLYRIAQNKGADLSLKGNKAELLAKYKNCDNDAWYSDAMAWLIDNGIIFVDDAMPQSPISVIDTVGLSVSFSLLAEKLGISFTENPRCDAFKNMNELPDYAVSHVEKLRLAGILVDSYNKPGYLEIDSIRTRAQCARIFEMVFDDLGLVKPDILPDPIPRRPEDDKYLNYFEIADGKNGNAVLTKYIGTDESVVIPEVIAGKKVTEIGEGAFKGRTDITSIEYNSSIVTIGAHAFEGCKKLRPDLPNTVEWIGSCAFKDCEDAGSIYLPITVKYIGKDAFDVDFGSISYKSIDYAGSRDDYDLITVEDGEYAEKLFEIVTFSKDYHETDAFRYTPNSDGTAVITEYVGSSAYVTVPAEIDGYKITKMQNNVFGKYKDKLKELTVSEGIEYVDGCIECVKLQKVILPESIKTIGTGAFMGCTALESITLPEGLKTIGQSAFNESGLKSIVIPGGTETIGSCFKDCKSLTSVTYSEGCTKTGSRTFEGCTSLSEINLPETMKVIGESAFDDHIAEAIVIPASVKEVKDYAFFSSAKTYMYFKGHLPEFSIYSTGLPSWFTYFYRKGARDWEDMGGVDKDLYVKIQFHSDVSYKSWYRDSVAYVLVNGLMNGTSATKFEPNTTMTRAMLVTVLWRLDGSPAPKSSAPFGDLKQAWYKDAVAWAAENEIVLGVGGDRFDPNGNITREQMATILYRFSEYKGYDTAGRA